MGVKSVGGKVYNESGVAALISSPRDAKILCLQRFFRLFGYGGTNLILVLFLSELGLKDNKIGLFMSITLAGDTIISLALTIFADRIGRRVSLAIGSVLLIASGVVFALFDNYWLLLVAGTLGVINPSANEVDPFKAVEESTVSLLSSLKDRSSVFAWYVVFGTAGQSAGTLMTGWIVGQLQMGYGWTNLDAYRVIFWIYAGCGVLKLSSCFFLSTDCERGVVRPSASTVVEERRPLLGDDSQYNESIGPNSSQPSKLKKFFGIFVPQISRESWIILGQLCFIFAVDSLSSGLAPVTWMTYFFNRKFGTSEGLLGTILFIATIVSSAFNLVSASLSRYIGLVKVMVAVNLPPSVLLAIIPLPGTEWIALALLVIRMATKDMDMAPRQAFVAAAVLDEERTAVMGVINIVRSITISIGPVVTGTLANSGRLWIAFVVAGCLKIGFNVLLTARFWNYKTREERESEEETTRNRSAEQ